MELDTFFQFIKQCHSDLRRQGIRIGETANQLGVVGGDHAGIANIFRIIIQHRLSIGGLIRLFAQKHYSST